LNESEENKNYIEHDLDWGDNNQDDGWGGSSSHSRKLPYQNSSPYDRPSSSTSGGYSSTQRGFRGGRGKRGNPYPREGGYQPYNNRQNDGYYGQPRGYRNQANAYDTRGGNNYPASYQENNRQPRKGEFGTILDNYSRGKSDFVSIAELLGKKMQDEASFRDIREKDPGHKNMKQSSKLI
jgi:hypothetical protein